MDIRCLPEEARDYIRNLEKENTHWELRYTALEEEHQLLLLHRFGKKSEKESDPSQQTLLFDDEASEEAASEEKESISVSGYTKRKKGRKPIDDSLHRKEVVIDISE